MLSEAYQRVATQKCKRALRRRDKGGEQNEVRSKRKRKVAVQLRPVSGRLDEKMKSRRLGAIGWSVSSG